MFLQGGLSGRETPRSPCIGSRAGVWPDRIVGMRAASSDLPPGPANDGSSYHCAPAWRASVAVKGDSGRDGDCGAGFWLLAARDDTRIPGRRLVSNPAGGLDAAMRPVNPERLTRLSRAFQIQRVRMSPRIHGLPAACYLPICLGRRNRVTGHVAASQSERSSLRAPFSLRSPCWPRTRELHHRSSITASRTTSCSSRVIRAPQQFETPAA